MSSSIQFTAGVAPGLPVISIERAMFGNLHRDLMAYFIVNRAHMLITGSVMQPFQFSRSKVTLGDTFTYADERFLSIDHCFSSLFAKSIIHSPWIIITSLSLWSLF